MSANKVALAVIIEQDELLTADVWHPLVRWLSSYQCNRCPATLENSVLCAHHIDRDQENNRLSNGECLCRACHTREHRKGKRGEKYKVRVPKIKRFCLTCSGVFEFWPSEMKKSRRQWCSHKCWNAWRTLQARNK